MASFSKLSVWPTGYFRSYSSWLLRQRRDVARRIQVLNAEIERIGVVKVSYLAVEENGKVRRTEQRTEFSATENSSVGRLLQAYIAMGGDPLSISPFMHPEQIAMTQDFEDTPAVQQHEYPNGGVVAPMSGVPNEPVATDEDPGFPGYQGGYLKTATYYPARQGGRTDPGSYDHESVVRTMRLIRDWANQDLKELQDLEWRIIKQCDLREQLVQERDGVLVQAFGGALTGVGPFDPNYFDERYLVQNLVQDMYRMLYEVDDTGKVTSFTANLQSVALAFTFPDDPTEIGRDMLGC